MRENILKNEIANEIMHVYRRMLQQGARVMESMNIGVGQVPILKLLSENGTMTQRQIAEEIRVTPATICGTIKRMERAGLILRAVAEHDGRVTCISLTDEGKSLAERAFSALEQAHEDMLSGFSDEECSQLAEFVRRMGVNLTRAVEEAEEEMTK